MPASAKKTKQFTVIHEVATPHGNVILSALKARPDVALEIWALKEKATKYGFKDDLTNAVEKAKLYSGHGMSEALLKAVLCRKAAQRVLLIGWSNPTTRVAFLLLALLRRPFGMWFDLPQENAPRSLPKRVLREFFYWVLRISRAHVFAVGQDAVDYFKQRGLPEHRISNLPILVEVEKGREAFATQVAKVRKAYGLQKDDVLLSAGSRLIHDKGFDLVIEAIGALPKAMRARVHCVIVGQGEELENLKAQAKKLGIGGQVHFPGWMDFPDYQALIAASRVFIHPARFDAWGATIFAHALGVPVVGSVGAGSARERIEHGKNGWLFNPENPKELTQLLQKSLSLTPAQEKAMGKAALATARVWAPSNGAAMLIKNIEPMKAGE